MSAPIITVDVPTRFWDDHVDRDLIIHPTLVTHIKTYAKGSLTRLTLSREDAEELLSDAEHYATFTGADRQDNLGLCSSARATALRLYPVLDTPRNLRQVAQPLRRPVHTPRQQGTIAQIQARAPYDGPPVTGLSSLLP